MVLQPLSALNLSDGLEAPAHRVLADDLLHAQQLGEHAIAAKRRDVGIAFMPRQNREHCRAEHIALLRRVGARISERAIGHERVEQARHLEILDEEWQLPVGRQRRCGIPFDPHRSSPGVKSCWRQCSVLLNRRLFTRRVSRKAGQIVGHVLENARFSSKASSANCRI